jgi:hypothetical protein
MESKGHSILPTIIMMGLIISVMSYFLQFNKVIRTKHQSYLKSKRELINDKNKTKF